MCVCVREREIEEGREGEREREREREEEAREGASHEFTRSFAPAARASSLHPQRWTCLMDASRTSLASSGGRNRENNNQMDQH